MSKKSEHGRVVKDERDVEKMYQAHLQQAMIHARNIADDTAHAEAKRSAAAETETALRKVEEARLRAEKEKKPEAVKSSFWDWLTS